MSDFLEYVQLVRDVGVPLKRDQARSALRAMLTGDTRDQDIAALLTAIANRGETVAELTGFAEGIRSLSIPFPLAEDEQNELVDTCGTGGDGQGTLNISTGAALLAAAAGAKIAKHGNRAVTSLCGSADVLEALGVPVAMPVEMAAECLRATGFMFLYAPLLNPSLKRVHAVRKSLGFRTIFNLAGPLSNPAKARAQVVGIFGAAWIPVVAQSLANLGVRHAFVVYGLDGLDEMTTTAETMIAEVRNHSAPDWDGASGSPGEVRQYRIDPRQSGLEMALPEQLRGGSSAAENAAILEAILNGEKGPKRDVVVLNAAGALTVAGVANDLREGVERAFAAIDSGAAAKTLAALREFGRKNAVALNQV